MICAVGIDSVDIERFKNWHLYSRKKLGRIFSEKEIDYCLSIPAKSAERFAIRFAVKEAFFKALCQGYPGRSFNLLDVAKICEVSKKHSAPELTIDWEALKLQEFGVLVSLTHTQHIASAAVIFQK